MNADNSHAETRILARTIEQYDARRSWFPEENESDVREEAIVYYAEHARIDYCDAAQALADALARRATKRIEGA